MEKGTRLSGIFDYLEAAKSHDSRIIGTRLYVTKVISLFLQRCNVFRMFIKYGM